MSNKSRINEDSAASETADDTTKSPKSFFTVNNLEETWRNLVINELTRILFSKSALKAEAFRALFSVEDN